MSVPALEFRNLRLAYVVRGVPREVLRDVSFSVQPGESYGLVGESGCGKSTAAYAAIRYLPGNARIVGGSVHVAGRDKDRRFARQRAGQTAAGTGQPKA